MAHIALFLDKRYKPEFRGYISEFDKTPVIHIETGTEDTTLFLDVFNLEQLAEVVNSLVDKVNDYKEAAALAKFDALRDDEVEG